GAEAGLPTVLMTPLRSVPPAAVLATVAMYPIRIWQRKKSAASTAVERDRKLADPLAPNRLPEAPLPKAAPISAPLPCCSRTRPMMQSATMTSTMRISVNQKSILHSPELSPRRSADRDEVLRDERSPA